MAKEKEVKKTIYTLKLHQTMEIEEDEIGIKGKKYEVTRVPGGWIFLIEYPGYRQAVPVFVPFDKEFISTMTVEAKGGGGSTQGGLGGVN